jgi:hypothetical protein
MSRPAMLRASAMVQRRSDNRAIILLIDPMPFPCSDATTAPLHPAIEVNRVSADSSLTDSVDLLTDRGKEKRIEFRKYGCVGVAQ